MNLRQVLDKKDSVRIFKSKSIERGLYTFASLDIFRRFIDVCYKSGKYWDNKERTLEEWKIIKHYIKKYGEVILEIYEPGISMTYGKRDDYSSIEDYTYTEIDESNIDEY